MKKLLLTIVIGLIAFTLAACNDKEDNSKTKTEETSEETTNKEEKAAVDPEELQKKLDAQKVKDDSIVAIVNGQEIKGIEYNNALAQSQIGAQQQGQDPTNEETAKQLKELTLNNLVGQVLLMQDIERLGYRASEEEITKELETEKARFDTNEAFEKALKDSNMTLEELKKQISDGVKVSQYIEKDLKVEEVKEEEIKKLYDSFTSSAEKSADTPKYEDIKDMLKAQLTQQKLQEKIAPKVEELRKSAEVELKI
ncbi:SurA N-terminal domain-containing protein [Metabacillus rhizolycopersici]|uniref:SurA N-terminal domain-containing protein n=1 Tax=Metabacillus rhizolycopersici TaxID=2875709 RepID=A0ABS7UU19_9BACI|nr:SurA N-terminal domain-containing protein [Metabacillus rhizolycopersici]MBZ5751808.1 SurA N-terminal domain-containing protein [Metabacillus rhizolycopersici]